MKLKIKKLNDLARVPVQARDKDFCYDVYATSCEEIEPGIWKYGLGLGFEIERGWELIGLGSLHTVLSKTDSGVLTKREDGDFWLNISDSNIKLSIDFRPRSSIFKTGLILSNCSGTIDELYRDEVCAFFYEIIPGKEKYKVGDRIGQIKLGFTLPIEFEVVDELDMEHNRGGGFGSSGK